MPCTRRRRSWPCWRIARVFGNFAPRWKACLSSATGCRRLSGRKRRLVVGIMGVVHREPGLAQSGLKAHLGAADGRRVSQLAAWLEKAGRVRRVKKGSRHTSSTRRSPPTYRQVDLPRGAGVAGRPRVNCPCSVRECLPTSRNPDQPGALTTSNFLRGGLVGLAPVMPALALITQRSLLQIQPTQPGKSTSYGTRRSP